MILLEQQVCSLELATKLKQLGIQQKSLFYWVVGLEISVFPEDDEDSYESWFDEEAEEICTSDRAKTAIEIKDSGDWEDERAKSVDYYSAFTVAELGEILPARIRNEKTGNLDFLRMHKGDDSRQDVRDNFTAEYHTTFEPPLCRITADSEANCRAKMLIYLIEHNLYDPQTQKKQTTV